MRKGSRRFTPVLVLAAALGGCATSPDEMRQHPPAYKTSASDASTFAACIARRFVQFNLVASSLPGAKAGEMEVTAQLPRGGFGPFAVVTIRPTPPGSTAAFYGGNPDNSGNIAERFSEGC